MPGPNDTITHNSRLAISLDMSNQKERNSANDKYLKVEYDVHNIQSN